MWQKIVNWVLLIFVPGRRLLFLWRGQDLQGWGRGRRREGVGLQRGAPGGSAGGQILFDPGNWNGNQAGVYGKTGAGWVIQELNHQIQIFLKMFQNYLKSKRVVF